MKCKFKMVENAEIKILKLFDSPRITYSGIRRHVYYCMFTDVTEEPAGSIFMVQTVKLFGQQ
jgi:hypothetical protein